ncbi:type II secretion system F family protein [Actinomadura rupiterrae]|uniref:type II secretion system F family protein n=1 Tax=Actinomadura rupiterrae TaxID=559627 RepID=UPI0020A3F560|nr:type II secretion system F family protein [Actinomadura rupiterrae]MCP2337513.1 pilus assembly protein TadC [Actinomadura rupiterrae]
MSLLSLTGGSLIGLGATVLVGELYPAPPRLADALARLEGTAPAEPTGRLRRLTRWADVHNPQSDLELVGLTVEAFVLKRLGYALLGLVFPTLLNLTVTLATGATLPWQIPAAVGVLLGAAFGLAPDIAVRRQAAELRREFRAALSTYLDLVALERAAGSGPGQALHAPADVCGGWVFERIATVLRQARRSGEQPWRGLAELGRRVGVAELTELADIAEDAGSIGAQVLPTLLAKSQSMRTAALTDARARANSRTSEMPVAIAMSIGGFLLLVTYPALYRLFIA